jgi:hypothetical protein
VGFTLSFSAKNCDENDRKEATQALTQAKELITQRLEKIADDETRYSLLNLIPVMQDVLEAGCPPTALDPIDH